MKLLLLLLLIFCLNGYSQPAKSGTYIFKYCDIEYNKCISSCRVVVKGYFVTIYATKELAKSITGINPGDIVEQGKLVKNQKGQWTIIPKSGNSITDDEILLFIDFSRKEFWRY